MSLKDTFAEELPAWRERVQQLLKESGDVKVGEVTISQVYGGMRDIKSLVTDISYVDPDEGIRFRGYTIPEVIEKLPKPPGAEMPYSGGLYFLLMIGRMPTEKEALEVEEEWHRRMDVPPYVFEVLKAMPRGTSPLALFSQAVLAMQQESIFVRRYADGMKREQYWEPMLEDSLNLTARLPAIAAYIYSMKYKGGDFTPPDPGLDWSANFAHMMGVQDKGYADLSRLYFLLHSDHESGNVSAHSAYLVSSALSDIYFCASAALDGLAGPLHGRANQESLRWLLDVEEQFGRVPTHEELSKFAWETLEAGQVIPGYGHAVLRKTDPRYTALLQFGRKHMMDDDLFNLANLVYEVVPDVLKKQGRARDPWPNVDAISSVLQYHYGVKVCEEIRECGFYTVIFGVGRMLGVTSNVVWARALHHPIERPKSLTTAMLEQIGQKAKETQPA
jgi:citrate synthase